MSKYAMRIKPQENRLFAPVSHYALNYNGNQMTWDMKITCVELQQSKENCQPSNILPVLYYEVHTFDAKTFLYMIMHIVPHYIESILFHTVPYSIRRSRFIVARNEDEGFSLIKDLQYPLFVTNLITHLRRSCVCI